MTFMVKVVDYDTNVPRIKVRNNAVFRIRMVVHVLILALSF